MGEFCEFDIDFEQFDDLRAVVVHDECGAHEDVWFYRFDVLKAENAKLRELVRDMWFGLYCPTEPTDGCPQCPFNRDGECFFEQRMRELGMDAELGVDE